MTTYSDIRTTLESGDLALYTTTSGLGGALVQLGTHSKYNHVGVIWVISGRVFLLEATLTSGVRMIPLSRQLPDVIVKMGVTWTNPAEEHALEHILEPYSIMDALRAWLHKKFSSSGWICTEYAASILQKCGFNFPDTIVTPQDFASFLASKQKEFILLDTP